MVALNAHVPARIGIDRRHHENKEQGMSPSSAEAPGSGECQVGPIIQNEPDFGPLRLAAALGAACVACERLSACSRLEAMAGQTPKARARAAFLHAAARFLRQAWLVLDPGIGSEDWQGLLTGLTTPAPWHAVGCLTPVPSIDEQAIPLTGVTSTLASKADVLAGRATGPTAAILTSVQACISAAAGQLRAVGELARPAPTAEDPE
jgi:hypothetical protein